MPKCKNDPKGTYIGKEPSPKGRGFCARAIKEGVIMTGRDGNDWIVRVDKRGVKSWKPLSQVAGKVRKTVKKKAPAKKVGVKKKRVQAGMRREAGLY